MKYRFHFIFWCAKQLFLAHWAEKWSVLCFKCRKHLVKKWERGGD